MTTIRPATPDDAPRIAEVWEIAWLEAHLGHVPDELVALRDSDSFRTRAAGMIDRTLVAEVDGVVVGFVTLKGDELEQLFVDASARGTGVARDLLAEGARWLLEAGHPQPWLAVATGNARARRFYEREGWRDAGHISYASPVDGGVIPVSGHRYELILPQ
ncbi:GNAT family N-acetyltransferase [Microbacterium sp. HD4P20]|uniref:GNAT family N-acetyltransferase n=1 Tax=Microbacterium sp. HD4P20 TaxID=2864874 RepID=UPI001C63FF07|nr:GNAT family N-acetyltransferase [Microbacterium sp. HD4P20]MCP2636503.1 GNAT family N-acetyltransferase [Microbacterium sp. HD4P20]